MSQDGVKIYVCYISRGAPKCTRLLITYDSLLTSLLHLILHLDIFSRQQVPELSANEVSKDIFLEHIVTHYLTIKTTILHIDTVSVIVGCSLNPVAADLKGVVRLSNALTRVEERLLRYIECTPPSLSMSSSTGSSPIPDHDSGIITMWEDGQNDLFRTYAKDLKTEGIRIKREYQKYPNKRFDETLMGRWKL